MASGNTNTVLSQARESIAHFDFGQDLEPLLRPTIHVRIRRTEDPVEPGASRFGGSPDLPNGMERPTNAGRVLTHVAQIRLHDVTDLDPERTLPPDGWLVFFVLCGDPAQDDPSAPTSRVLFIEDGTPLQRMPDRADLPLCGVDFAAGRSLPDLHWEAAKPFVSSDERWDLYHDLILELEQIGYQALPAPPSISFWRRLAGGGPRYGYHQMLGYPGRVPLPPEEQDHVILLHARTDLDALGVDWDVRGASLCYHIPPAELAARNFDAVTMAMFYED